ncbi:uncharacterized protein N7529_008646 [Penicillium soppii]|uniref:uncharacterized protein n=1 Tax=Penicillium soppii TaxID=69789 RepID=UPI002548F0E8|nr:uncharacterized protein N7529_008646 [Penicillium soppii]KAJ5861336.1 hypothetical protein N7529_008646 [Penicillium soppii]
MIRRPPTLIALEEDDIESHLQRIYLRHTLTLNFEQLQLDDFEDLDQLMDEPPSSSVPSDFDGDSDINNSDQEGSPCHEHNSPNSPRDGISMSTDVISQFAMKPCLKSPISNLHRSLQNPISSAKSRSADGSTDPPRLKVTFALSPQDLELHRGIASVPEEETVERFGENYPTSHKDIDTPVSIDSPASPQVSFLSCGVSSSPVTAGVPLRDLTLASTMSYEAVLAEQTVPPASPARINEGRGFIVI